MNITNFLFELSRQGIKLALENGQLKVRAPKTALTATITSQLKEYKEEILIALKKLNQQVSMEAIKTIIPAPQDRYKPFPLTEIQQAYWVARSGGFELGNVTPHVYIEFENSDLNVSRLELAWQKVIERHDVLRTVLCPPTQQQVLEQVPSYKFLSTDLRQHTEQQKESLLENIRKHLSHQQFDPTQWPRFDIQLIQISENIFRLCVSLDLSAIDFVGIMKLLSEWGQYYQAPAINLPILQITFRDYVLAEFAQHGTQAYQQSLQYWLAKIDSLPPPVQLPQIKTINELNSYHFKNYSIVLTPDIRQALLQRARQYNLTLSGIFLAGFAEILTTWSDTPFFTLNLTQYNRLPLHPQSNQIIGDSTSIILLAVDNRQTESFSTRAQRIQQQLWQDLNNHHINGITVLRELARRQQKFQQGTALMPVVFTSALGMENFDINNSANNILGKRVYGVSQTPQVWFDHQIFEQEGNLYLIWDVVEELFPTDLIEDMFTTYCEFLISLSYKDEMWHVPSRPLLPPYQLVQRNEVNATAKPLTEKMLHTLFLSHVENQPDAPAIITTERTISYRELYLSANQIGRILRQFGAQPNQLVAVVMEKGWEQVVAVYGILFSGAAYLPIDAELPEQRIHELLTNSEAKIVLTQNYLDTVISWPTGIHKFCVGSKDFDAVDDASLNWVQTADDLAYVLYTSGSTGIPKGVMVDHRGPVNTLLDVNQRFNITQNDRVLALSSLSFDLSVFDIFGLHCAGGAIVIPIANRRKDPSHWVELMQQTKVTFWNSVPTLLQMLIEYLLPQTEIIPVQLGKFFLSGDWIATNLPEQVRALWPQIQVLASGGGATEASIWNIFYLMDKVNSNWKRIPYGKPMNNSTFYVLNELLEHRPIWAVGELYTGGIALAKGYWRDPDKTEEKFIIHPVTQERLYKTGDLGRYLPDGNIEILGRIDFQVKINGYRVELNEIETILNQHPQINKAIVIYDNDNANKQLIAYWVPKDEGVEFKQEDIRIYLADKLPEYMVPAVYIRLLELPLTANGKLNRDALPKPKVVFVAAGKNLTSALPQTEIETKIHNIVSRILTTDGSSNIDVDVNLFDAGANSLNIVQLHAKLKEEFAIDMPIVEMFRHPTIRALAAYFSLENNKQFNSEKFKLRAQQQKAYLVNQKASLKKAIGSELLQLE